MHTDTVLAHYIVAALWSSTDEQGEPLEATRDDLAPETLEEMEEDVTNFLSSAEEQGYDLSALSPEMVGHDFWLTRNGHGAGFWDRGLGQLGDDLTELAKSFGSGDLYMGDDGLIYA